MRSSDKPRLKNQRGFTMIEVMTAAMILSGMVIGIGSGWVVADREVTNLITKQKAIFMADAEMEQLTVLYGTTSFGSGGPQSTTGYTETAAFPSTRLIYPTTLDPTYIPAGQDFVVNTVSSFTNAGSDFQVWVQSNTPSSLNRAYMWIDYANNIVGRISWTTSNISPAACVVGGDGCPCLAPSGVGSSSCQKLTFYMEYPYHMVSGSPVAESNLRTITLSTIVGRHL
jgi:prepilin-type N-terminal cleavage/methylation domain-containing protein